MQEKIYDALNSHSVFLQELMLALTDTAELCLRERSDLTGSKRAITSQRKEQP